MACGPLIELVVTLKVFLIDLDCVDEKRVLVNALQWLVPFSLASLPVESLCFRSDLPHVSMPSQGPPSAE